MENEIYEKDYGEEFRERSDKSEGKDFLDTLMEVGFFQKYQEEMNKIISNMKKNREQSKNHNGYWMNVIYGYYVNGVNSNDPKNFDNIINKLTPKDIQKFARALFKDADIVDIIFKPKAN